MRRSEDLFRWVCVVVLVFLYTRMVRSERVRTLSKTILDDRVAWDVFLVGMAVISCLFYLAFIHGRSDASPAHYALFPIVVCILIFDCVRHSALHYTALALYMLMVLWIIRRKHGSAVLLFLVLVPFCAWCLGTAEILFLILVTFLV